MGWNRDKQQQQADRRDRQQARLTAALRFVRTPAELETLLAADPQLTNDGIRYQAVKDRILALAPHLAKPADS